MNFENRTIVIAEANFLQIVLYKVYTGSREFDQLVWREVIDRLQTIRDVARKEENDAES